MTKVQSDSTFKGAYIRPLMKIMYINQISPKSSRSKVCNEIIMTLPVVIYSQKNFYLLDELNEKLESLKSAGLMALFHMQYIDKRLLNDKEIKQPSALTLYHFRGCFHIFIYGCTASGAIFLIEIFVNIMRKKFLIHRLRKHRNFLNS